LILLMRVFWTPAFAGVTMGFHTASYAGIQWLVCGHRLPDQACAGLRSGIRHRPRRCDVMMLIPRLLAAG